MPQTADHDGRDATVPTNARPRTVALLGNPNVGKTTLFNRCVGVRSHTANFPGTTQEALVGAVAGDGPTLVDLPGTYSLDLNQSEARVCRDVLEGNSDLPELANAPPDALVVVLDASNLRRNLILLARALQRRLPTVVAITMSDTAARRKLTVDADALARRIGCPVIHASGRTGEGVAGLLEALQLTHDPPATPAPDPAAIDLWADETASLVVHKPADEARDRLSDRLDRALLHPVLGVAAFAAVMTALFYVIFRLAAYPMDWIDMLFAHLGGAAAAVLPQGLIRDMVVDGAIAGVGATVIFLPQICLLFLLISILEGTGYLARAALVVDRWMRPFGLSGHAFVPMLSGHACALPGIMATRAIPDPRERLAAILVLPFMSCTARIPVYVLLTALLFPDSPAMQAVAFTACYAVGALAGLFSALVARRLVARGRARPMALELPPYRLPDWRSALLATRDRALVFLKKAGGIILAISIILWWLGAFPAAETPAEAQDLRARAAQVQPEQAQQLADQADAIEQRHAANQSFLGRIGATVQPVFAPLGFDRQLTIGVIASFAAREVFVSTMAVQVVGTEDLEEERLFDRLANATRADGTPIFTAAVSWALLVYYVLAMQCLPTLVVTAREAGGWRWAALQLAWMSGLAYVLALATYQSLRAFGIA